MPLSRIARPLALLLALAAGPAVPQAMGAEVAPLRPAFRAALPAAGAAAPAATSGEARVATPAATARRPAVAPDMATTARAAPVSVAGPRPRPAPAARVIPAEPPAQALPGAAGLRSAMAALRRGDWDGATRAARAAGPEAADLVEWHRLRAGKGDFSATLDFLARHPDWPGLDYLRERSEGQVPYRRRAADVIAFFDAAPPKTGAGIVALAAAYEEAGRPDEAIPLVIRAWQTMPLTTGDERYLLERYGALLNPHHAARLDDRVWDGDREAAERLLARVSPGEAALARARLGLREMRDGIDTLVEAVPPALRGDPGLAFERFNWRARKGRNEAAIELALAAPDAARMGRPAMWGNWRRILARWAMRNGAPETAYRLASQSGLSAGSDFADMEWVAGYVALRALDDPDLAAEHFRTFRTAVASPISLGRAGYWLGRAEEAAGRAGAALEAYRFGGQWQTSFYGLLAAEKAGMPMDPTLTGRQSYPPLSTGPLADSSVVAVARIAHAAGEEELAERFMAHAAEGRDADTVGGLVDFALTGLGDPHIALMVAKRAADAGVVVPRGYYPVVDLGVGRLPVPEELALSIARRESEFDPAVKSGAGALGLMQVMPGTARDMAAVLDVAYNPGRLLNDPSYNARLGTTYLAHLTTLFGPNHALVAAGYNAGPSRPIRWMEERGDPRDPGVDPVDWIESIPFTETQNYVMRVMESLPVYRARLSGETEPIRLSQELKAR